MFYTKNKVILIIIICLITFFLTYKDVKSEEKQYVLGISKVIDGDTILINSHKIRFYGIDAPEKNQFCKKTYLSLFFISLDKDYPCGKISKNKLKKITNNHLIKCHLKGKDRYKRFIGECFKNKLNLNSWMVRNGYALAYTKYSKKFISEQEIAKKNKHGIWIGKFQEPWIWRKTN